MEVVDRMAKMLPFDTQSGCGTSMKDIAEWLASLDLAQYAQTFAENGVDLSVVRDLTDDDLKELGVLLGHRRKLLRAAADIAPKEPASAMKPEATSRLEAERRLLSVMFCDLVGSTDLTARLDPEDMRDVLSTYHSCIAEVLGRFNGMIARYMGDGVLAYFGYPQAHEDDAEQAVQAGLTVVEEAKYKVLMASRCKPVWALRQVL
jgi:hypothetical protein